MRSSVLVAVMTAVIGVAANAAPARAQETQDNNGRYVPAVEDHAPADASDTPAQAESAGNPKPAAKPDKKAARPKPEPAATATAAKDKPAAAKNSKDTSGKDTASKDTANTGKPQGGKAEANKPEGSKPDTGKIEQGKSAAKDTPKTAAPSDPLADIPAAERQSVRAALLWAAGDETPSSSDPIASAIDAFRKRNNSTGTGPLTAVERDQLMASAKAQEAEFGWTVVTDPATGIRLGLPAKFVPNAKLTSQGTLWSSRHGDIQVETFRFKTSEPLNDVFARMKKEPANRRTEYSAIRNDNFIISGIQGLRKFSVRAFARDGEVRGMLMQFDQAMEGVVAPVMVAMASAFAPFPARATPFAALSRTVDYGTGVIVSQRGDILTDRRFANGCQVTTVAGLGNAEVIAQDSAAGLTLLRVYGKHNLHAAAIAPEGPDAAGAVSVVGVPDPTLQDGAAKLSEIKARLAQGDTIELQESAPVAGFSGAAAIDAQGRIAGIMETRSVVLASSEPGIPPLRLVPASAIRGFLADNKVTSAPSTTDVRTSIVRVICVRHSN